MRARQTVCFDDVLLEPQYSEIMSRSEVDLSCELGEGLAFQLPVISSPMDTVTEHYMSLAMAKAGGLGVVHRYNSIEEQSKMIEEMYKRWVTVGPTSAAIGATGDFLDRATALYDAGVRILCIDIAHGHHALMKKALGQRREVFGDAVHLMAGNIATLEGFDALAEWGADSVRVGIGGGSICSTRLVSGHGIPTLQSVLDCSRSEHDVKIIADGGIKTTGDMVKALAAGADFVMIGSMLAGTDESPGDTFVGKNQKEYKVYRGMASNDAQRDWRGKSSTPEGISTTIAYKGPVGDILKDIRGGICSGLSYSGVREIKELQSRARFVRQTASGTRESYTHILATRD